MTRNTDYWNPTQSPAEREQIPWTTSDVVTSNEAIKAEQGVYGGAVVVADDDGGDIDVIVYDNDSAASGVVLDRITIIETTADAREDSFPGLKEGILAEDGIYVDITGDCEVIIYYK